MLSWVYVSTPRHGASNITDEAGKKHQTYPNICQHVKTISMSGWQKVDLQIKVVDMSIFLVWVLEQKMNNFSILKTFLYPIHLSRICFQCKIFDHMKYLYFDADDQLVFSITLLMIVAG